MSKTNDFFADADMHDAVVGTDGAGLSAASEAPPANGTSSRQRDVLSNDTEPTAHPRSTVPRPSTAAACGPRASLRLRALVPAIGAAPRPSRRALALVFSGAMLVGVLVVVMWVEASQQRSDRQIVDRARAALRTQRTQNARLDDRLADATAKLRLSNEHARAAERTATVERTRAKRWRSRYQRLRLSRAAARRAAVRARATKRTRARRAKARAAAPSRGAAPVRPRAPVARRGGEEFPF